MKKISFAGIFLVFCSLLQAQSYTISGYISDEGTGERLIAAGIIIPGLNKGTVSNTYGFYSITVPSDSILLTVSYSGYTPFQTSLKLTSDFKYDIKLKQNNTLENVTVTSSRSKKIEETTQMGTIKIPVSLIKAAPKFMGETDVIKVLQLLPGVQSGSEGSSGLYVRGGSPDQNLILLDGTPVYNVSHLFGFFSVFNGDAIKNVELVKGGFPARYGGRLSSVLDINLKDGNNKEFHGEGGIGLIASRLTLEGPIVKNKTSFIVSGRRTYVDVLSIPFQKTIQKQEGYEKFKVGYYFYDLNAKVNHTFSNRDKLYFSIYGGDDKFYNDIIESYTDLNNNRYRNTSNNSLGWGNITSTLRWNHQFNKKLFANTIINYTRYKFRVGIGYKDETPDPNDTEEGKADYSSGIKDWGAKIDFDYIPHPDHYIKFGISGTYHTFNPGIAAFKVKSGQTTENTNLGNSKKNAFETFVYAEDDWKVNDWLKMNLGIHASSFSVDSKLYTSIQPRINTRILLPRNWAFKTSYTKMTQYINLLTNTGIALPTDLWVPVTGKIPPMNATQFAAGFAKTIFENKFEFSVEGYYKKMKNVIEYLDGSSAFSLSQDWQNQVETGIGTAYGAEIFLQKKTGKTTGWIGYTLSWNKRQFPSINFGREYPFRYDHRHDIKFLLTHRLSKKIDVAASWAYTSGDAVTLALQKFPAFNDNNFYQNNISYYAGRNDFRMKNYHRMDLSISFKKQKKWGERSWNVSVYNAYNRQNPFFYYIGDNYNSQTGTSESKLKQVSLFPVLPSVSYNFKF
jgi:TonB-dependent Receptor Plug Domain/CarboxypepD_reg-like domain/TonB dependent receptor